MCVAIYKPKGVDAPDKTTLLSCWTANPDGAGYATRRDDGKVEWVKGFMTWQAFYAAFKNIADIKEREVIIHFRIGTSGGNTPGNTHPFPITDNVDEMKSTCGVADEVLMHNGVLHIDERRKDISDTMELVLRIAESGCGAKGAFSLLKGLIGNDKLFAFTKDGSHVKLGLWQEIDGCWFSNTHWQWRTSGIRQKTAPVTAGLPLFEGYGNCGCYPTERTVTMPSKRELKQLARDYYGDSSKYSVKCVKQDIKDF